MGTSANALTGIPPPPAGFVPEQAGSVLPPPPGFVPEADREAAHQARVAKQVAGAKATGKLQEETSRPILGARAEQGILPTLGRAATGLGGMFKEAVTLTPSGVIPFANKYFVQPQIEQFRKAGEAQTLPEKVAYGAAGALPIAGPIAASAGEQISGGDIAGGLTTGALALATRRAPEDVIRAGTKTARTGTAMVKAGAENLGLRAPEAPKALRQAIQPSVNVPRARESIDIAGPRLQQVRQTTGAEYNSPADLLEGIKAAKASVHDAIEQRLGPVATLQADTSGVAKAMEGSISGRTARQYPATAEKIQTRAATYRGNLSLREIENSIQDANNQLRDFYKRPVATDSPISADTAATEAEVRTLRKLLDDKVSQLQGAGVADLKREYGALRDVERSTARANAVATRQKGATLWEGLAALRAAGDFASGNVLGAAKGAATLAVGRMLQKMRDPNYLIQQAFQGKRAFPAGGEIPPVAGPNIRGLLPSGPTQLGPVPDTSGIIPPGQGVPMPGFATKEPNRLLPAIGRTGGPIVTPEPAYPDAREYGPIYPPERTPERQLPAPRQSDIGTPPLIPTRNVPTYPWEATRLPEPNLKRAGVIPETTGEIQPTKAAKRPLEKTAAAVKSTPSKWLDSLGEAKEPVFSKMREIRAESDRLMAKAQKLQPPYGQIAIGTEHIRPFIKGDALATFLREIGRGSDPDAALEVAKKHARESVKINNSRRPGDYEVQIADMMADSTLESAWRKLKTIQESKAKRKTR